MNIAATALETRNEFGGVDFFEASSQCMAILWARKLATEADKIEFADTARKLDGVTNVEYSPRKPLILMVEYQNNDTSVLHIVNSLRATESEVRLIGC